MADLVHIPFHGTEVLAVDVDGRPHIVLRPALSSLGLEFEPQRKRLLRSSWATTSITEVVATDGRLREMTTVDVRTFLMLLATISETRIAPHVRPLLVAYQSEVADVIESYWTKGGALNPRLDPEDLDDEKVAELWLAAVREKKALAAQLEIAAPKTSYYDTYVADADLIKFRTVAKRLGISESDLRKLLIERKWIYAEHASRWSNSKDGLIRMTRYSAHVGKREYFQTTACHDAPRFRDEVMHTLKITPKGAEAIARLLSRELAAA